MKFLKNKYVLVFIIATYIVCLGFLRDHIFLNINFRLAQLYYNDTFNYTLPSDMQFIEQYSYKTLFIAKWLITALFCAAYFIATYIVILFWFGRGYIKPTLLSHLGVLLFALLLFGVLKIFGTIEMAYKFPRWFMGWLQSPIMMFILIPIFKFQILTNNHTKQELK